jgi:hypothetical protein
MRYWDKQTFQNATDIPGHGAVIRGTVPDMQPDVRQQAELREKNARRVPPDIDSEKHKPPSRVTASTITHNDWHGMTVVNLTGVGNTPTKPAGVLAIPQNLRRKKFIIINPDTNVSNIYMSYKNTPYSLIPIYPGGVYVEQGNDVSRDDIYIWCQAAQPFGAYEGSRDIADE